MTRAELTQMNRAKTAQKGKLYLVDKDYYIGTPDGVAVYYPNQAINAAANSAAASTANNFVNAVNIPAYPKAIITTDSYGNSISGVPSELNNTTEILGAGETYTGTGELNYLRDVMVSCKSNVAGTLYFDFSNDDDNWDSFPSAGFVVSAGIHEFHIAVKGPRYFRVRYVNGASQQEYLRLYTYYGDFRQGNLPLNQTITSDADSIVTQSVIIGQTDNGDYVPAKVTVTGESYVSVKDPVTGFGELQVAENTAFIQTSGIYEFMPAILREYSYATGTTGVTNRMFTCTTGTTIYGYGAIQSFRSLNYKPGQGGLARFTALFPSNTANHWSGVGLVNLSDELSFGYNGTTFGIWYRKDGVAECRTVTVTGASGGSTNLTLTLNSVAYTIPLTAGTTAHNAYEIATWINNTSNQAVWQADQIGSTVILIAASDGAKSGTYTYSHATSTGTITQNKAGVTKTSTHIPQTTWNIDTKDTLDPTKGNVYQIQYQYLGFGDFYFYVENPNTGRFDLVHIIKNANSSTTPTLRQPALRFGMYSSSQGSTTNITVQCASVACFVQGKITKTRNPRAVKNSQSCTTSFTNILTLRNRRSYNSLFNQVEIEPQNLTISSESSQNVEVEVRGNPTFSGDTNFQTAGTNLVGDVDTTANTVSGGTLLAAFTVGSKGNLSINLAQYEIAVPPTLQLTISAKVTSGASSVVTAALTYYEDL